LAADERSPKQRQVLDSLLLALEDGEWVVRYGAIAGLEGLAQELPTALQQKMLAKLQAFVTQETEITVRARGKKALSQFHQS
jgi:phycocyanobilin lyase beta subunit